jgi:Holliday junction DNA helicase RuvA
MIGKLTGLIDSLEDGAAIVDVAGVGYVVGCSSRLLQHLTPGEKKTLWIETVVREDAISLYGFADRHERAMFRALVTVPGVGAKVALAILGAAAMAEIARAVTSGNRTLFMTVPGVGAKLTTRIIAELRDRASLLAAAAPDGGAADAGMGVGPVADAAVDATSALINLGFRADDVAVAVRTARARLGDEADAAALIRAALGALQPGHVSA